MWKEHAPSTRQNEQLVQTNIGRNRFQVALRTFGKGFNRHGQSKWPNIAVMFDIPCYTNMSKYRAESVPSAHCVAYENISD